MSRREIVAYNYGRDNWEDITRRGVWRHMFDLVTGRPSRLVAESLDGLGPDTFATWALRGAQEVTSGAVGR